MDAVSIFFICMFILAGIVIASDDGTWNRKKK
jgi:hypothetical protein